MIAPTKYVLGFAFNQQKSVVVLISKNKPAWQALKLNGIGGKVEVKEKIPYAMVREFKEEAGVQTEAWQWTFFASVFGDGFTVYCFKLCSDEVCFDAKTTTEEEVNQYDLDDLSRFDCVENIHWLIEMAIDPESGTKFTAQIGYK